MGNSLGGEVNFPGLKVDLLTGGGRLTLSMVAMIGCLVKSSVNPVYIDMYK